MVFLFSISSNYIKQKGYDKRANIDNYMNLICGVFVVSFRRKTVHKQYLMVLLVVFRNLLDIIKHLCKYRCVGKNLSSQRNQFSRVHSLSESLLLSTFLVLLKARQRKEFSSLRKVFLTPVIFVADVAQRSPSIFKSHCSRYCPSDPVLVVCHKIDDSKSLFP